MANESFTKKEILQKVKEIFQVEFTDYKEDIKLTTTFKEIKGHKLDKKEFIMQLEENFELRIAQRNLAKINTVEELVNHLYDII